jgi:hypothetical protein
MMTTFIQCNRRLMRIFSLHGKRITGDHAQVNVPAFSVNQSLALARFCPAYPCFDYSTEMGGLFGHNEGTQKNHKELMNS